MTCIFVMSLPHGRCHAHLHTGACTARADSAYIWASTACKGASASEGNPMKRTRTCTRTRLPAPLAGAVLATVLALATVGTPAAAAVSVSFVAPENFRDLPFSPADRARVIKDLGEHFVKLDKLLPPGQTLTIDVIELDMAGRMVPNFRAGQDLRVLRGGADWPHMTVRYTLSANGQQLAAGQDQLSDMSYLDHLNRYPDGDSLRYEKQMVDAWFKKKFAVGHKG